MSPKHNITIAWIALIVVACTQPAIYTGFEAMPNDVWHRDSIAQFTLEVADTTCPYNLVVDLRNTTDYRFQNLYLFIDIEAPNGAVQRDTLECFIADDAGRWLGKGRGYLRDNRFLYRQGAQFAMRGEYHVRIQQAMRDEILKGIAGAGFRLEQSKK
ncbi:MAG: gliding motility lipoprotein GldH [Bacteroidales bacterium]|nr:gliding motility lipoprotein GldH [Bacteroidales bacterium]